MNKTFIALLPAAVLCAPLTALAAAASPPAIPPGQAGAKAAMRELGKTFLPAISPGAGHGFLRAQDGRDGANRGAANKAWLATVEFLRKHLE